MGSWLTAEFFQIIAAAFFVGIIVGLTGMGGGALMTPALIFLGVGGASTVVTADLTAAAIYKSGGAITHAKAGQPNWTLAKWLILGSVPVRPRRTLAAASGRRRLRQPRHRAQGVHRLRAAVRRHDLRPASGDQPAPRPQRWPGGRPRPAHPAAADPRDRCARRPAGGHHQRRLGLGDHDLSGHPLPGSVRPPPRRHRPGAGRAAGDRGRRLQHRPQRARLAHPGAARDRLAPGHDLRQPDRPAGPAVVHPSRHRDRADDVRAGAPRQGRLGAARRRRGPDAPGLHRAGRARAWSW